MNRHTKRQGHVSQYNIPQLRFPEFEREWQSKKIVDFAPLQRGFDLPVSTIKEGEFPVVFSNGILKTHNEFKVKAPGVVTGRSGTIGKVTYVEKDYWPHNTALWVTDFKGNHPKYVYYFYNSYKLERFGTGSGVPTLNRNDVHINNAFFPTLPEQQRIATFLTAVDEKLTALKKKKELLEQYKKGVMQKLFSQQLRFKPDLSEVEGDENGNEFPEWEVKKLGEIAERITLKNSINNQNVLTISAQFGLINQEEFFNKSVSAKDVSGYYLLKRDEFAYNKSYSSGYPMGAIKRLNKYDKGVVSTLYICFKFIDAVNLQFMEQYFESGKHNHELSKIAQEGARNHGLLNIAIGDFFSTEINLPTTEEQTRIANFLSAIDKKINETAKQIEATAQWKKGLLQQMFV